MDSRASHDFLYKKILLGFFLLIPVTREYIIVADNRKSMSHHEKSFTQKVGSIKRMKKLPPKVLEEIYFKSKLPAVTYGTVAWENCR